MVIWETINHGAFFSKNIVQCDDITLEAVQELLSKSPYYSSKPEMASVIVNGLKTNGVEYFGWATYTVEV